MPNNNKPGTKKDYIDNFSKAAVLKVTSGVKVDYTPSVGESIFSQARTKSIAKMPSVEHLVMGDSSSLCFLKGTLILTDHGEVPVQELAVGDMVLTKFGGPKPIVWLGRGRALATRGRRDAATPIIVRRWALGDRMPHRDLHITKGHALYLDNVLIPVEELINHRSIAWDDHAQEINIYHVSLREHDVLLANGAPAESYRDDGNLWLFENAATIEHEVPRVPCAPIMFDGPLVDAVWLRLLRHAGPRPGFPLTTDPDLHLQIDGHRMNPTSLNGLVYVFYLPHRLSSVSVISRAAIPMELGLARDPRPLGVALKRIVLREAMWSRAVDASDDRLQRGFHTYEQVSGLRWTDGRADISDILPNSHAVPAVLELHLAAATQYVDDGCS